MKWLFFLVLGQGLAISAEPRIDRIVLFGTNQVTIHFQTEANKTHALQYTDVFSCSANSLPCSSSLLSWSNLFVAPPIPFVNHYVIADMRTQRQRFYRLRVSP